MYCLSRKLKELKAVVKRWVKELCPNLQKAIVRNKVKVIVVQIQLSIIGSDTNLEIEEKKLLSDYKLLNQMETMEMR